MVSVPEEHYPSQASGVLMVDRYSAYKAMLGEEWLPDLGFLLGACPPRLRAGGQDVEWDCHSDRVQVPPRALAQPRPSEE